MGERVTEARIPVNTFFAAANWYKIINQESVDTTYDLSLFDAAGSLQSDFQTLVPAAGSQDIGLHALTGSSFVGLTRSSAAGTNTPFSSEVLRVFPKMLFPSEIDYIFNIPASYLQAVSEFPSNVPPVSVSGDAVITGELRKWHKITLTWDGPSTSETASPNPFSDYRLDVTFRGPSGQTYVVPGYFAADGNAAETSAVQGAKWRAHISPDEVGTWTYSVSFRAGTGRCYCR